MIHVRKNFTTMKRRRRLDFSCLLRVLCIVLGSLTTRIHTAIAAPSTTGIFAGKYGKTQIFDCQRQPKLPRANSKFHIYDFANILNPVNSVRFPAEIWGANSDRYVRFHEDGSGGVRLRLYEANGTFVRTISENGTVWGLGEEGFLYVSSENTSGYFVSKRQGFAYGDSLTYTPTTGKVTDLAVLREYEANGAVLNAGEAASGLQAAAAASPSGIYNEE